MIYTILEKCLAELNKDEVDSSYIKGMLETLLAMQEPMVKMKQPFSPEQKASRPEAMKDDAAILDQHARASIETIKALAEKSIE